MKFLYLLLLSSALCACVLQGQNLYTNDPLTGGKDASSSQLLHIPLPAGLQYYPSHGKISGGGRKEGLEVFRGHVDQEDCGSSFYARLRQAGWQLRMFERAGDRAIYVYQKDNELATLLFQAQGMLTIVQVWAGPRLADNATISDPGVSDEAYSSLPGETFGPADKEDRFSEQEL